MSFNLYLLRHAKSDWSSPETADFERTINKRGKKNAKALGQWMNDQKHCPGMIISSPAVRARETAVRVAKQLDGARPDLVHYDNNLYLADRDTLLKSILLYRYGVSSLLLIAHNPGLDHLVEYLASSTELNRKADKLMTTATLCMMRFRNEDFAPDIDIPEKVKIIRPSDLV